MTLEKRPLPSRGASRGPSRGCVSTRVLPCGHRRVLLPPSPRTLGSPSPRHLTPLRCFSGALVSWSIAGLPGPAPSPAPSAPRSRLSPWTSPPGRDSNGLDSRAPRTPPPGSVTTGTLSPRPCTQLPAGHFPSGLPGAWLRSDTPRSLEFFLWNLPSCFGLSLPARCSSQSHRVLCSLTPPRPPNSPFFRVTSCHTNRPHTRPPCP